MSVTNATQYGILRNRLSQLYKTTFGNDFSREGIQHGGRG